MISAEEDAFLTVIAANPFELTPQLVYADWLGERGRKDEIAWRWIATFRRRPDPFRVFQVSGEPYWTSGRVNFNRPEDQCAGYGWGGWSYTNFKWPESAGNGMLPWELFRWLPRGNSLDPDYGGEHCYDSVREAFEVLAFAFVRATAPRNWLQRRVSGMTWNPDWSLANLLPDESVSVNGGANTLQTHSTGGIR